MVGWATVFVTFAVYAEATLSSWEQWPARVEHSVTAMNQTAVHGLATLHMVRDEGGPKLWMRLETEDDGGHWRLESSLLATSQMIGSDITVASVVWTLVKDVQFTSSHRSVVVTLPRLVALISDSPRGSAYRTLRTQVPSTVTLELQVGSTPWLRYILSAGLICGISLLLYRFVFIHMESLSQDVKARAEQMRQAKTTLSSSSSSSSNVQVFSAATNEKQVKRYGASGATVPRGVKGKKNQSSLAF